MLTQLDKSYNPMSCYPGDVRGGGQGCAGLPVAGADWPEAELLTAPQPEPDPVCHGVAGPPAPHPLHMAQSYGETPKQCHLIHKTCQSQVFRLDALFCKCIYIAFFNTPVSRI